MSPQGLFILHVKPPWQLDYFLREKIGIHLETWGYGFEIQYGFTEGGRGEFCLFTLNYIANRTYESQKKKHKQL